jgi:hypothetical protein
VLQEHLALDLSQLAGHVSHFLQFLGRHVAVVLVLDENHLVDRGVVRDVESANGDLGVARLMDLEKNLWDVL